MDDLEYYINQFTGGISSDEYLTPDGACFDMENIDINKSSMCITASGVRSGLINTRPGGRTISVASFGSERASYDGVIEGGSAIGASGRPGDTNRPCLFAMPRLGPKLLSSGGSSLTGFGRNDYITGAVRGNMNTTPFWLVNQYRLFSLIHPDALYTAVDSDNQMTGISDFTLGTGWSISGDYAVHSSGTDPLTITKPNQYGTYSGHTGGTDAVTNYQMFWFGISDHHNGSVKVKVKAPIATFQWSTTYNQYIYTETSTGRTANRDSITATNGEDAWFCFAINGLDGSAEWTIIPSNDFDGKIFCGGIVNAKNYLSADNINSNLSDLALDNCYIANLRDIPAGVDSSDLQSKIVITPGKGGFIVGKGNYVVMLNMKDDFQIGPALDMILPTSYEIMGITVFGDQIIIYANSNGTGYQMVWDGASIYPDYTYVWEGQTFETVISSMDYDYVTVCSHRDTMQYYVVSGPKRSLIGGSDYFSDEIDGYDALIQKEKSRILTQRDDKEVRGALGMMRCGQPVFAGLGGDMLVYGTKKAGFGNAWYKPLSLGYEVESDGEIVYPLVDCLGSILDGGIGIYYTNIKGEHRWESLDKGHWYGYGTDHFYQGETYNKKFSYTLNPIMGSHFLEKEIDKLFISYKLPNNKRKINLYAKIDDDMFLRFLPTTTVNITKGAIYKANNADATALEYICTDGNWLVFRKAGQSIRNIWAGELHKQSGEGDSIIYATAIDDWIKVGELNYNGFDHNYENLINSQVYSKLPFFHKIQFKIECEIVTPTPYIEYTTYYPPEIYNIYIPFKQHTVG